MALEGEAVELAVPLEALDHVLVVLGEVELLLGHVGLDGLDHLRRGEVVDDAPADGRPHRVPQAAPGGEDGDLLDKVLAGEALVDDLDVGVLLHKQGHLLVVERRLLASRGPPREWKRTVTGWALGFAASPPPCVPGAPQAESAAPPPAPARAAPIPIRRRRVQLPATRSPLLSDMPAVPFSRLPRSVSRTSSVTAPTATGCT